MMHGGSSARSSLKRLLGRSSVLMAARFAGAGLAFAGNVAIARFMGADALGVFAMCMAAASLIAVFLPLGRQATATLFVSEYLAKVKPALVRGYVSSGHKTIWSMTAIAAVCALVVALFARQAELGQTLLIGALSVAMAPALAFIGFNGGVLTGAHRQFSALLPESILRPAFVLLAVLISVFAWQGQSSTALVAVICIGCWCTAGLQAWLLRSREVVPAGVSEEREMGRWRATSWPWMFITLLWDYFIELHLLLAGMIATSAEIAVLHICFRLRVLAGFGMRALYAVLLPDMYGANATDNRKFLFRTISRANALACAYAVAVCGGVWLLGEFALGLVDQSFRSAHTALIVMCLTMLARAIFGPATAVLSMKGHQLPSLWTLTGGLVVSVVLSLLLFPMLGILGVAIAYLTANTIIAIVQWQLAWRLTGIDCSVFAFLRKSSASPEVPAVA
ncbi:MAG: lipopolysaccharide biosynthesis protein [Pseudomonadota bacterium]